MAFRETSLFFHHMPMASRPEINTSLAADLAAAQRRLLGYIMTLAPNLSDAEDILQNTNARIVSKAEEYNKVQNFAAWAYEFARYEVLNYRKRRARDPHVFYADDSLVDVLASEAQSQYYSSDKLSALQNCEQKLATEDRKLLAQRYEHGRSVRDIASQAGRTEAALRQSLYRIRRALLRCIERQITAEGRR